MPAFDSRCHFPQGVCAMSYAFTGLKAVTRLRCRKGERRYSVVAHWHVSHVQPIEPISQSAPINYHAFVIVLCPMYSIAQYCCAWPSPCSHWPLPTAPRVLFPAIVPLYSLPLSLYPGKTRKMFHNIVILLRGAVSGQYWRARNNLAYSVVNH